MDLEPGGPVDLRGAVVDRATWTALRRAATDPDGVVRLGRCRFERAVLEDVSFRGVRFEGDVSFDHAEFRADVSFFGAVFRRNAGFFGASFAGTVTFHEAVFHGHACLAETRFAGDALFGAAVWHRDASFREAWFGGPADFDGAVFHRDLLMQDAGFRRAVSWRRVRAGRNVLLDRARFRDRAWLGPAEVGGRLALDGARASRSVRVTVTGGRLTAREAVFRSADLRLCASHADLTGLSAHEVTVSGGGAVLAGAVSARTSLARVPLDACVFAEARLGDLRLSGCTLDEPLPKRPPLALAALFAGFAAATDDAAQAREFRYRAMEVRRAAEPRASRRALLALSWLTCGYGLRTGRAAVTSLVLVVALVVTAVALRGGVPVGHLARL